MQLVLKHRVQCLQWYIALVVSFASYPCNEHKTHVGRAKCESDTSIVRHVIYIVYMHVSWKHSLQSSRIDDEVTARTAKASVAFGRLRTNVWERNGIRLDTKLKVYKAVVLPTLLYACETWTVYQRHAKKLNHFHLSCLRKLLKIRRQDKIPDTEVLKKAKIQSVHTLLKLAQLRWTGHVTRMPDERLPKKVLYKELQEGKRSQGSQKKRYKDTLKASLKDFNIPIESWEQAAQDRTKWRCLINKGASQFEEKRICEAERKRKERKARAKEPSSVSAVRIHMLYLQLTV